MTVYQEKHSKTGKLFWRVDVTWENADGTTRRIRKTPRPNTRKHGEQLERDILQKLAAGTYDKKEAPAETLASFRERYFRDHVAKLKPSARSAQETIWRVTLLPELGNELLSNIDAGSLAKLTGKMLARKAKPKTVNNALSALRTALTQARRWKLIDAVPEVEWVKVDQQKFDHFSKEEVARIVEVGSPMVTTALKTGMRIGELLALKWDAISFARNDITVSRSVFWEKKQAHEGSTKSTRVRHLPMTSEVRAALKALHADAIDRSGYVFTTKTGAQLTRNMAKRRLWPVLLAAGVRRTGWHVCRHTFASILVAEGAALAAVQKLMGHATIQMTMRYAHLAPEHLRDTMALLEPGKRTVATSVTDAHRMPTQGDRDAN